MSSHQGIQLLNGGYEFSTQEVTQGESYQEFGIIDLDVYTRTYEYACCPSEPWPVVIYHVKLSRAYFFYFLMLIFPGMFVTVLSFLVFMTDSVQTDPLGYGIGVIVVVLLQNVVLIGLMPICGELLWNNIFWLVNTIFCCLSLFESAFCIMLEAHEDEHLLPMWLIEVGATMAWVARALLSALVMKRSTLVSAAAAPSGGGGDFSSLPAKVRITESIAGMLYRQMQTTDASNQASLSGGGGGEKGAESSSASSARAAAAADSDSDAIKLMKFERLFYQLDEDCSLFIDKADCEKLFSFALLHLSIDDRQQLFKEYQFSHANQVSRREFVSLCKDWLWNVPADHLEIAVHNLIQARDGLRKRHNAHWTRVSKEIDRWCRIIVPVLYLLSMLVVFNIDLRDRYLDEVEAPSSSSSVAPMFSGLGPWTFNPRGYIGLLVLGIATLLALLAMHHADRIAVVRSAKSRELLISMFMHNLSQMEGDGATFGLSPCLDSTGTLCSPEYDTDVGKLRRLACAPFEAEPVHLGGSSPALLLRATRFVQEFHNADVPIIGPASLVEACFAAGVPRAALALRFSPFSKLNLPLAARKAAHIPIPAERYAYVYPIAELADVEEAEVRQIAAAHGTAAEVLANGGYAYVDQTGALLALNAIVYLGGGGGGGGGGGMGGDLATRAVGGGGNGDANNDLSSTEPAFRLAGPFATPKLAYDELSAAGRLEPVVQSSALAAGARVFAWIRSEEFGLHAPFGGFAFAPARAEDDEGGGRGVYFALLPKNVPQATVSVDLAPLVAGRDSPDGHEAMGGGSQIFCLTYPLRSRVAEIKRGIEAQVAISVDEIAIWGPLETSRKDLLTGGKEGSPKVRKAHTQQLNEASLKRGMRAAEQELKDELPLDAFGITNGASVKLRVERKPPRLASPRPARPPAAPVTAASSHSSRQQLQKDAENDESPPAPNGETQFFV